MVEKYTGTLKNTAPEKHRNLDSGMFKIENERVKKTTDQLKAMIRDTKELVATSVGTKKPLSQSPSPKTTKEITMEDWRHPDHGFEWGKVLCENLATLHQEVKQSV